MTNQPQEVVARIKFRSGMDEELQHQLTDAMLERLLPCNSRREYQRELAKLAVEFEWGQPDGMGKRDGDPINRYFWGCVTKLHIVPTGRLGRTSRHGFPFTWVEQNAIGWATTTTTALGQRPDATYLATIFNRHIDEVAKAIEQYGPGRGRKGFGLT